MLPSKRLLISNYDKLGLDSKVSAPSINLNAIYMTTTVLKTIGYIDKYS